MICMRTVFLHSFADDNMGSRKEENIHYDINDAFAFFVKEDAAIYVLVLGTFYLLSRKDKKED